MTITEILGGIGTLAGVGGIITFGVMAWRSRGEAMRATERQMTAYGRELDALKAVEEANRKIFNAEAESAAARKELAGAKSELERVRAELAAERAAKGKLYAELAKRGAPVGDVVVDDAIDGLYEDKDRGKTR